MNFSNIFNRTKAPIVFREKIKEIPEDKIIYLQWVTPPPNDTTDSRTFYIYEVNPQTGEQSSFFECRTIITGGRGCSSFAKRWTVDQVGGRWQSAGNITWSNNRVAATAKIKVSPEIDMSLYRVRKEGGARAFQHDDLKFKWFQFPNEGMICLGKKRKIAAYFDDQTQMLVADRDFWDSLDHIIFTCFFNRRHREFNDW